MSRQPQAPISVVAAFPSPDLAKSAMAALERSGTPSRDVRLLNDVGGTTTTDVRAADERNFTWITRRMGYGALVGAVIGAVIMVVAVTAIFGTGSALRWFASAFGGALFGAVVGAFVWIGTRTPRNPQAWDTYLLAHRAETCLAVAVRGERDDEQITTILQREGAHALQRVHG